MSIIATAVRHLMAAGVTGDALVTAIEDMERDLNLQQPTKVRSAAAIRQERYRDRNKASQTVTSDARDVTSVTSPLSLPPNENNSNPPTHTPVNINTTRAKGGTDLPEGWEPKPFRKGTKSLKIMEDWPPGELETQIEHFTAHHRSRGTRFKDWQDAWSTWVLNSRKFGNGTANRQSSNPRQASGPKPDGFMAALREVGNRGPDGQGFDTGGGYQASGFGAFGTA